MSLKMFRSSATYVSRPWPRQKTAAGCGAWRRTPRRVLRGLAPILCAPILLSACTANGDAAAAHGRVLRVGFSIERPYAFVDTAGEATGEEPEILKRVSAQLGITDLQWFPMPFHNLIPALETGRIDVIASGMFVTPERRRYVRFSRPTECVRPVFVTRRTPPAPLTRDCPACRLAAIQGSVEARVLKADPVLRTRTLTLPDLATAATAISQGTADALAISAPTARILVHENRRLVIANGPLPEGLATHARGCAALAFRPADTTLAARVDSVLRDFVGSQAHLKLMVPFGFDASELPPEARHTAPPAPADGQSDDRE